jgi:LPS-assembly protein
LWRNRISRDLARATFARLSRAWSGLQATRAAGPVALAAIAAAMAPFTPNLAVAQSQFDLKPKIDSTLPMLLQADQMVYDNQNNRVIAKGNVEIYYNNYTLLADKVVYDRGNNLLKAEGNVRIKEPNGALINTNRITLTDDFRDGFIQSLKIVTQQDVRIAAARAIREKGETTIFERAVYTPCKLCEDNPEKAPTWQIKAKKIIHKKSEATIEYRNATFEMFGVPVLKLPYFKHADPSVKRKSGFLIPSYGNSEDLGTIVETPYYFALAPNYDFTFSPVYTSKRGLLVKGKWRHRTKNGRYNIFLAGIDQTGSKNDLTASPDDLNNGEFRGTIESQGDFNLNQFWSWGWDITAETDDTFRRFYDIDNIRTTDRISQVNLTGQRDRNYFDARLYHLGGLSFDDTNNSEARVLPVIDYNYIFSDPILGGELSLDTNVLSLTRNDGGADSSRLITELKWRKQIIDKRGQVITPFFSARGDLYQVSKFTDPITGKLYTDESVTRGMVAGGIEYRYPFVQHTANAAHILEPIAQIIARPSTPNQTEVPNEDALSLVFDDTLLFDIDKFSGYDRIESGTRANAGLRYTFQRNNGGYIRAVVGQSYQVAGSNKFTAGSGLENDASDFVAGLYIQPMQYFRFIGQTRFDKDDLSVKRTDLSASANYGPVNGALIYANLDPQTGLGITTQREEIQARGSLQLTKYWSLIGSARYDIAGSQRIDDSLGVKYSDDCFALTVTYRETFIRDRDIQPNSSVMLRFEFKYLGAYDLDADVAG